MIGRVRQGVKQAKIRIFGGVTKSQEKIVSVFEPHTEIIRKGKASKPTEFGELVKIREAENQIVTHFKVFAERPPDSTLLLPSVEAHQQLAMPDFIPTSRRKRCTAWGAENLSAEQEKQQCRTETSAVRGVVSSRTEMENRLGRPHQHA
jgi:hypothetical protein